MVLARTICGEVRAEPWHGQVAVGWVIKNRTLQGGRWGRCVEAVCQKPHAFACWNTHEPTLDLIISATPATPTFRSCLAAAAAVLTDLEPDPTQGATRYHILGVRPFWSAEAPQTCIIGRLVFYRDAGWGGS